jgi:hypothetical protein
MTRTISGFCKAKTLPKFEGMSTIFFEFDLVEAAAP